MSVSFKEGTIFPFESHQARIQRYQENMQLFKGQHKDLFDKYNFNTQGSAYISLNLAGIICKKSADMLLGEAVQVSAGKRDESDEQKALDRITSENYMNISNYESALSNGIKGDSFYKIRYGQEYGGQLPVELDAPKVIIENLQAETVYPEASPFNKRQILTYHVCVPVFNSETDKWQLHVESHQAGKIVYHSYNLKALQSDQFGEAIKWSISNPVGEVMEEQTGANMPLIVHVPNIATDSWEGLDDLSEHKSLFDEINNRLTQVASILDKHSDPAIAVPMGMLETDDSGNVIFNVAREKVFEMMNKEDVIPQYITWNGQLQEAYSELDRLIDNLLVSAEIPAVALGKGDSGTSGSTGLAIRFRMSPLLSKINRKRQYYDKALKQVYLIAQQLEKTANTELQYETVTPVLKFSDGLPKDTTQEANMMATRTGGQPTMSQKTAIMELDGKTEEQAEAEIKRIQKQVSEKAELEVKEKPETTQVDTTSEPDKEAPDETAERKVTDIPDKLPEKIKPKDTIQLADETVALNGAQVASMVNIVQLVQKDEITRDSAIEVLTTAFPISRQRAQSILGNGT